MAVIYVDFDNGVDTVGATRSVSYSNPSGNLVRGTSSSHGYSNGDYVYIQYTFQSTGNQPGLTGFVWEIENVSTNTFDLKGAVWGTGSTFSANTYKLLTGLNTSAPRKTIVAGRNNSITKIKKSPDPISIGNATWTTKSVTITLAAARTQTVDNCETAWTAANTATVTRVTSSPVKEGTYKASIVTPSAGTAINTKYAYFTLPTTLDLSAYQNLSFKVAHSGNWGPDVFRVVLCSDTLGNTIVDSFQIPKIHLTTSGMTSVAVPRTGGGNLGSAIASIAVYTGANTPGNSTTLFLDNIIASKTDDIDHTTLLTKSSTATWHNTEQIVPIMSIDGTTVTIDMGPKNNSKTYTINNSSANKGYYTTGTSPETVTTYIIKPIYTNPSGNSQTQILTVQGGTLGVTTLDTANRCVISGGWDFSTDTLNGMTWLDGRNHDYSIGSYTAGSQWENIAITNSGPFHVTNTTDTAATKKNNKLYNFNFVGSSTGGSNQAYPIRSGGAPNYFENINVYNCAENLTFIASLDDTSTTNITFQSTNGQHVLPMYNYTYKAVNDFGNYQIYGGIYYLYFLNATLRNIGSNWFSGPGSTVACNIMVDGLTQTDGTLNFLASGSANGYFTVENASFANTPSLTGNYSQYRFINSSHVSTQAPNYYPASLRNSIGNIWEAVGNNINDNRVYPASGFRYVSQTAVRKTPSGIAWQMFVTQNSIVDLYMRQAYMPIAKVACSGNKAVTVKAWVQKSAASSIGAALVVDRFQYGLSSEVRTDAANNTSWQELSVTFTPTAATVIEVGIIGWWISSTTESIYVDDVTVTEAA